MLVADDRYPKGSRQGRREGFCAYSLEDWLESAAAANVPMVPAKRLADFEKTDLLNHERDGPHQKRLDNGYALCEAQRSLRTMVRWDCCAPAWLKAELSEGELPSADDPRHRRLPIDARLLEALWDFPRLCVPAWERPWIGDRMKVEQGYPVEYRVFVLNGALQGISSYYPQRALRRNEAELDAVRTMVSALLKTISAPMEWDAGWDERTRAREMVAKLDGRKLEPEEPTADGIHFTADFVATTSGVLLLEGGPPWWMGAHPCCFPAEHERIRGVALKPGPDAAYQPTRG